MKTKLLIFTFKLFSILSKLTYILIHTTFNLVHSFAGILRFELKTWF